MKTIIEYINEASTSNKALTSLPNNMKEWYDKCKNFCTAGAWNLTEPKLSVSDFDGFLDAVKEFDFTQIKGLNKRAANMCEPINNLVWALVDKNKEAIIKAFDVFSSKTNDEYWFQNDLTRRDNGGYIAEAALIISMSNFLGNGNNWWKNSNLSTNKIKDEISK